MRRSSTSSSRHGGASVSRASRSRKITPQRASSCRANSGTAGACSRALSVAQQRPAPAAWRGRACRPRPSPRRRLGSIRARRLSKPSPVTSPAATSSHNASSTSLARRPVARARSAKNDAPRRRERFQHLRRAPESVGAPSRPAASSQPASSRRNNASGATRVGRTCRGASSLSNAGCGDSRPHITSPARHKLVQVLRAVARHAPRQDLASPKPLPESRSPATAGSPARSRPRRAVDAPGATCCQRARKRMKSAVVTGSISRRSLPMVSR